jgi:hypothetical protein
MPVPSGDWAELKSSQWERVEVFPRSQLSEARSGSDLLYNVCNEWGKRAPRMPMYAKIRSQGLSRFRAEGEISKGIVPFLQIYAGD